MKLWRYIALAGLVGAVVVIVSITLVKVSYNQQLDFIAHEQTGVAFQRPLEGLLDLFPCYQAAAQKKLAGDPHASQEMAGLQDQIDQLLNTFAQNYRGPSGSALKFTDADLALCRRENARLSVLQTTWNQLKQAPLPTVAQGDGITTIIASVRAVIFHAANTSDLVLDNQMDTYYLGNITAIQLPQTQQALGDITMQVGQWLRAGAVAANRNAFGPMAATLRQYNLSPLLLDAQVANDANRILRGPQSSLQKQLPPAVNRFTAACQPLLQMLDRLAAGQTVTATDFENAGWHAHAESLRLWQTSADELDVLLADRVQSIRSTRLQYYIIVVVTLLLAIGIIALILRSLIRTHHAELSRTAEILKARDMQLRVIGDNLPKGMVYEVMRDFDGTMRFLYVSANIERLNGLSPEAVLRDASLFYNQIHPEDRSLSLTARQESLTTGGVIHITVRIHRTDGAVRWMQFSSAPRRLPDGRFVWDGIETDVTDQKFAEAALQASEARFRSLSENSLAGIYIQTDGCLTYANSALERMLGYNRGELVGVNPIQFTHPEDHAQVADVLRRRAQGELKPLGAVIRMVRKDTTIIYTEIRGVGTLIDGKHASIGNVIDVTERKLAEQALAESENRFRTFIESAPVAISVSHDGRRIYCNRKFVEMFGFNDAEELAGKLVLDQWAPESKAMMKDIIDRRAQGLPVPNSYESVAQRKDGTTFPVHVAVTNIDLPDGMVSVGFATDISERKQAELRIRQLNRIYAVLSDINQTIVREKDPRHMLQKACDIAVSKGKFRMVWIGMLDATDRHIKPVASAGVVDGYLDLLMIDLKDGPESEGPAGRSAASGAHAICNDIEHDPLYAPWRDHALQRGYRSSGGFPLKIGGQVVGLFSLYSGEPGFFNAEELGLLDELAMDISFSLEFHAQDDKRRQAEAAVKHSEERFASIFHSSPVPIGLTDLADGKYIDVNESFLRMSGFTLQEVIGRTVVELGIYQDLTARARILEDLNQFGYVHQRETIFRIKSGQTRNFLLWAEIVVIGSMKCVLSMGLDITGQKQLEEQLRQTQKLEALGTLAGGIAHDFNNILGAIISFAELARMDHPHNVELQENLGEVLNACNRATGLVRQILTFSRQQKHELATLQLAPIIKEALKLLRATLPATIEIEQNIRTPLPDVLANPTQVHQIVMNLCTNAAHAMKSAHGRLTVELDSVNLAASDPMPHAELRPGAYVRLAVKDTGHGMDEATLKRIFEPFFTTKKAGEGTGLGLSVVHGIVKEHKGEITVQSTPGTGTAFAIYLPVALANHVMRQLPSLTIHRGRGETILFVDDEPALGDAAAKMLHRLGYQPVTFRSPESAWQAIQKEPAAYDAIIADLTMPRMTGLELARRVLEIQPSLPILLTTGFSGGLTKAKVQEKGIRDLLLKPLDYQSLAAALNEVLRPQRELK